VTIGGLRPSRNCLPSDPGLYPLTRAWQALAGIQKTPGIVSDRQPMVAKIARKYDLPNRTPCARMAVMLAKMER
jgi:hypothetical protein